MVCEASGVWLGTQTSTLMEFQESSLVREKLVEEGEKSKKGKLVEVDVGYNFETQQIFSSRESLVEWVRGVARSLGFVVTVKGSDKLTGRLTPRVFLGCDRGGKYRDNQNRKDFVKKKCRKSSSKRCGCSFTVKGQNWMQGENYIPLYDAVFGNIKRIQLLTSLECKVTPAPLENWMSLPDLGLVISSCYNVGVVELSCDQSFTFLPLHSVPPTLAKIICIGFINGNHFIQLTLRENCPLPPLFSPWTRYHDSIAETWRSLYMSRLH